MLQLFSKRLTAWTVSPSGRLQTPIEARPCRHLGEGVWDQPCRDAHASGRMG
jgi:hypothetical protein